MDETECAHCGKMIDMEAGPRLVLRPLSTGEQEEILVCQKCRHLFQDAYRVEIYCEHCRKALDEVARRTLVLRPLSTGEYEDMFVCQECCLLFDDHIKYLFTILGGLTSSDENQPPVWQNPAPLFYQGHHPTHGELTYVRLHDPERYANVVKDFALDTTQLPFDDFPLIEDFKIILQTTRMAHRPEEKEPRYLIYAFSPSLGYLALFDLHSHLPQDLCQTDFVIPSGDFSLPYADLDQGWNLLLAENEQFVYILTGNWEKHEGHTTWFKVEKRRYYSQWEEAIHLCHSTYEKAKAQ